MGRQKEPFSLIKRPKTKYWYYKLGGWTVYRSTGETVKSEAMKVAMAALESEDAGPVGPSLRRYAEPYFLWDQCPHVRRLLSEGRSVTRYHVKNMRSVLENHVFTDRIAKLRISEIKRADILDFRERLVEKLDYTRTVQRALSALKIVLKEAYFREDVNRDPTAGIGVTKYEPAEIGTFTEAELRKLFPATPPGPWKDLTGYGVFLTAATTGMRRGEILALTWEYTHFEEGYIEIRQAWKDRHELGLPKWNKTRTAPLPSMLAETLKRIGERKMNVGPEDLVFCYDDGERLGGTWWQKRFDAAMVEAKIDKKKRNIRPHSFRHTLNSLLREKGYDPAKIRAALGWADEEIQDNYTHWKPESLNGHREIVDRLFNAEPGNGS